MATVMITEEQVNNKINWKGNITANKKNTLYEIQANIFEKRHLKNLSHCQ
jgi:hypothetical protein